MIVFGYRPSVVLISLKAYSKILHVNNAFIGYVCNGSWDLCYVSTIVCLCLIVVTASIFSKQHWIFWGFTFLLYTGRLCHLINYKPQSKQYT